LSPTFIAHSLNPNYYSDDWLNGGPSHGIPPQMDRDILEERKKAFGRIYNHKPSLDVVEDRFTNFSLALGDLEEMMCS